MQSDTTTETDIARKLRAWTIESALPLWSDAGRDKSTGGFYERLHLDGRPDAEAPRRLVVQARQIYVYAHATALGWFDGKSLALEAFQAMQERYANRDGEPGYVYLLNPDGSVQDARRDTYAHAFILLALGWLARITNDAQIVKLIDQNLAFFDEHLTAADGTFCEGVPRTLPRRQNPHMHAFEAMLGLHETISYPDALRRAALLRGFLNEHFIIEDNGALGEFFTDTWDLRSRKDPVEPGHHAEWAWLLRRHEALAGLEPGPAPDRFISFASRYRDENTGLLFDEVRLDGEDHPKKHRCWPQTEYAKAMTVAEEAGGSRRGTTAALERLYKHYLAPEGRFVPGGWIDQFDSEGNALTSVMPASTFYHVFVAVAEACRVRKIA